MHKFSVYKCFAHPHQSCLRACCAHSHQSQLFAVLCAMQLTETLCKLWLLLDEAQSKLVS